MEKRKEDVAIVCVNSQGESDVAVYTVEVTQDEYDLGIHYHLAETYADEDGFDRPFICFDSTNINNMKNAVEVFKVR